MWYQVLIPGPVLMIPILIMTTKGTHSPKNGIDHPSDVIVTYSNHAEANIPKEPVKQIPSTNTDTDTNVESDTDTDTSTKDTKNEVNNRYNDGIAYGEITSRDPIDYDTGYKSTKEPNIVISDNEYDKKNVPPSQPLKKELPNKKTLPMKKKRKDEELEDPEPEDVIFIPNKKESEPIRNEFYLQKAQASLQDLMSGHKTVEDILASKDVRLETDTPGLDIIFVTGKNNEAQEITTKKTKIWPEDRLKPVPVSKLDCTNLNCNNTIDSICGEKIENYTPKLRLFLNDCYFRKVNCDFKSATNRYKKVPITKCQHIGAHYSVPPFPSRRRLSMSAFPGPPQPMPAETKQESKSENADETRRNFSSRRSMTMNIHGQFCSHPCPSSCPEQYEPECAVSSTGRHRVFVNHCALDHNSCSFGIVWHSVPLAECVGGKKADMRQNAGFIGWMQRVGVVDNRGRLVYDVDRR